jgi:hypothetical protein
MLVSDRKVRFWKDFDNHNIVLMTRLAKSRHSAPSGVEENWAT